jgi:hypothetical protein
MEMFLSSEVTGRKVWGCVRFVLGFVAALGIPAMGETREPPKSFSLADNSQAHVERKTLPAIDSERLLAEDRKRSEDPAKPQRFAVPADVHFTLQNSGSWQTLADGSRIWRLRIYAPGAQSLNLGIGRFDMPEGAKLWIYSPSHDEVQGPYTARNRSSAGSLFTPVIRSDEMVVEVYVPAGTAQPAIEIATVNQGYRGFKKD